MRLVHTKGSRPFLTCRILPYLRGGTRAIEPTTSDLGPFPAVRVQSGCSDLGQGRVQLRQLQAPQCPRTRLLAGLNFFKEPLGLAVMIGAIHGSPVVVPVLRTARDIWTYLDERTPADGGSAAQHARAAAARQLDAYASDRGHIR